MAIGKTQSYWYRLDNAAKIYPPTSNKKRPHVFSFSAILVNSIDRDALKSAAVKVLNKNPTFKTKLKRGHFWYYLEENYSDIDVYPEEADYLKAIDPRETGGFLFKITFVKNRLTVTFFHALTDGFGGFNFFSQLLYEYFRQLEYEVDAEDLIRPSESPQPLGCDDDSYLTFDNRLAHKPARAERPFKIDGAPLSRGETAIITAVCKTEEIKKLAAKFGASVTEYFSGVYIRAIYETFLRAKPCKNKLISLLVPCNLRKRYGGNTLRNFAMYARVAVDFSDAAFSPEECVELAKREMRSQLTTENLDGIVHSNVNLEKNPFIKLIPLRFKDFILRAAYSRVGENLQTSLLSNLGAVELPKSFNQYIKHLTFAIAPTNTCKLQLAVIGFSDSIYLTFSRNFAENEVERRFIRTLAGQGASVQIFSNEGRADGEKV